MKWSWFVFFFIAIPASYALDVAIIAPVGVVEDSAFNITCVVSCQNCTNVTLAVEREDDSSWVPLADTGPLVLGAGQQNPLSLGDPGAQEVNISLYAALLSSNALRCAVTSAEANGSAIGNLSVLDTALPTIMLVSPVNASVIDRRVDFLFTPFDRHLAACALWTDAAGWGPSMVPVNGSENLAQMPFDVGTHYWQVSCNDSSGNTAYSDNRTFTAAPDIAIASLDFPSRRVEGETIVVQANISNRGNTTGNVTVELWDGGVLLKREDVVLSASYQIIDAQLMGRIGVTNITVIVDPEDAIVEYDETNNVLVGGLQVSMWQTYYGNASGTIVLDTDTNFTFKSWYAMARAGNIYVSDIDTYGGVSFIDLHPLGKNASGGVDADSDDDFSQLDVALGTAGFEDSVSSVYAGGETERFLLYGRVVDDVPVFHSDESHTTGVLWDASDGGTAYAGTQDAVFVTKVRPVTQGSQGVTDYTIALPAALKDYHAGASIVTFYYEVQ